MCGVIWHEYECRYGLRRTFLRISCTGESRYHKLRSFFVLFSLRGVRGHGSEASSKVDGYRKNGDHKNKSCRS